MGVKLSKLLLLQEQRTVWVVRYVNLPARLAKALRMSGRDHIHSGTVVGKLEGERVITLGFVDLLRDDFIEKDRSCGIYFTQDWVSLPCVLPVASGGIHVWHMPALTEIFGDDSVLQFGGGTLGHPWGNAPGAVANRDRFPKFQVGITLPFPTFAPGHG
ncbi:hypothetical protein F8388_025064 [Cannabis sativa]|uniref:Ribulose bisphosphate carboxylase large subunit C-terminal domain-containing protein n=1 Tax=Cannabis sativa TaxID=3483 RepID=A0A7J6FJ75_CANSA|nr:hypothetical protein F8388_025064 [Cannabis sativa]